jgi:hypothetical protein
VSLVDHGLIHRRVVGGRDPGFAPKLRWRPEDVAVRDGVGTRGDLDGLERSELRKVRGVGVDDLLVERDDVRLVVVSARDGDRAK